MWIRGKRVDVTGFSAWRDDKKRMIVEKEGTVQSFGNNTDVI